MTSWAKQLPSSIVHTVLVHIIYHTGGVHAVHAIIEPCMHLVFYRMCTISTFLPWTIILAHTWSESRSNIMIRHELSKHIGKRLMAYCIPVINGRRSCSSDGS